MYIRNSLAGDVFAGEFFALFWGGFGHFSGYLLSFGGGRWVVICPVLYKNGRFAYSHESLCCFGVGKGKGEMDGGSLGKFGMMVVSCWSGKKRPARLGLVLRFAGGIAYILQTIQSELSNTFCQG